MHITRAAGGARRKAAMNAPKMSLPKTKYSFNRSDKENINIKEITYPK